MRGTGAEGERWTGDQMMSKARTMLAKVFRCSICLGWDLCSQIDQRGFSYKSGRVSGLESSVACEMLLGTLCFGTL